MSRGVQLSLKPNPQPLPYKGWGARLKASLRFGERNGSGVLRISRTSRECLHVHNQRRHVHRQHRGVSDEPRDVLYEFRDVSDYSL
jgi:hypothetical protein